MEVMLEIYRTLKTLHMEWKPKKVIESVVGPDDEDPKKKRRREEEERVKKAQELYFVETRCRMDDVMVSLYPSHDSPATCWGFFELDTDMILLDRSEWISNCTESTTKTTSSTSAT
jgi:hypothetical protein